MRKLVFWALLALLAGVSLVSCIEKDTLPPTVEVDSPKQGATLLAGMPVSFEADFEDDRGLKAYRIRIVRSATQPHPAAEGTAFSFDKEWTLPNRREVDDVRHQEITIPADAQLGAYNFTVYCTDQAGNQQYETVVVTLIR